jgi:hypothetical protein
MSKTITARFNLSHFREDSGNVSRYITDSTPNLFHLYKNQETNKINIGYLLAVSYSLMLLFNHFENELP